MNKINKAFDKTFSSRTMILLSSAIIDLYIFDKLKTDSMLVKMSLVAVNLLTAEYIINYISEVKDDDDGNNYDLLLFE